MPGKTIPISKTKIIVPPRRRELLTRPRLLDHLQGLLDNKLLLLSAPAGYGKTSLLVDLAHTVSMPVCWLSLDPLDRDPQRFIAYLIASIAERFPGVGQASRPQLNRLKSIDDEAENLLVTITNEIYENVEDDFLLILDDYHILDEVPLISDLVNRFLELAMENCHVLLSSRTLPSLDDVTLMVAREQVAGINHTDLAFLPRELQLLYSQNYHQYLSDDTAHEFVEQTGGWITGMVLSNLPGMPRISGVDTFSYLAKQVLSTQPGEICEFLIRSSLPDEFSPEFCEIVLGPFHSESQNWYGMMGLILEKNLFVMPVSEDGRWLRYHPLFREFLQSRLREERPHEVRPILERMVTAYEKVGEWEKAYFACKQLDDAEALAAVIERAGTPMLQNALVTLEGWINALPPAIARNRPGLISLRGMLAAMKGNLEEASRLLHMIVPIYRKDGDVAGLTLALTRRAHTLRLLGKYSASIDDIEEALRLAEHDSALQPLYAEALRLKGLNLYRLGESRNAVAQLEHSLSLYTELKEIGSIPMLLNETAMVHQAVGDVDSAKVSYERALEISREDKNLYYQAEILNNLGVLYHQIGEYELASETFESGLVCARKSRHQRAECLILTGLGDLYTEVQEFDSALRAYEQAEALTNILGETFIPNYLVVARGLLALLSNDLETASRIQSSHRRKIKLSQSMYEQGLWTFFEGRCKLALGEPRKAVRLLQDCKAAFVEDGRDLELQWSKIWLAIAYDRAGQRNHARSEVEGLIASAIPDHALLAAFNHAISWLVDLERDAEIGRQLSGLLERSRRLARRFPSIRRALRRHAQTIKMPEATLTIQAFGRPEVRINGRSIPMSKWKTQSVRDLFFYFLNNEEAVTKEQVASELWPEVEDPQSIKARFKNEIYRLRRAVGRDVIVFNDEYYVFNRSMDHEYDVEAFDSHLHRARKARDKGERIQYLRRAVDLVHGPFLADVDADWAVLERERLSLAFESAVEELAELHLNANQLEECLAICQRALEKNSHLEVIYQLQMRVYAALGDRGAIVRTYQACKTALEDGLDLPPSEATEQIYRELTA